MNQAIKLELDRIKAKNPSKVLLPKEVVRAARNPRNPLHSRFTWSKEKGFLKNLNWEARQLIGEYMTFVVVGDKKVRVRNYVSLTTDRVRGGGYRGITEVLSNEDLAAQLLEDALSELETFEVKYRKLKELQPIFSAISRVKGKVGKRTKKAA